MWLRGWGGKLVFRCEWDARQDETKGGLSTTDGHLPWVRARGKDGGACT